MSQGEQVGEVDQVKLCNSLVRLLACAVEKCRADEKMVQESSNQEYDAGPSQGVGNVIGLHKRHRVVPGSTSRKGRQCHPEKSQDGVSYKAKC